MDDEVPHLQTLLDLGASPDYKDSRGLTPLYHSALGGGDALCCELLLHDHAQLGTTDENGWQEIHQVGRVPGLGSQAMVGSSASVWDAVAPLSSSGLPLWARAAPGAPAILWSQHGCPECLGEHGSAHLCSVQPGVPLCSALVWAHYTFCVW
jgi:hypothetical protein